MGGAAIIGVLVTWSVLAGDEQEQVVVSPPRDAGVAIAGDEGAVSLREIENSHKDLEGGRSAVDPDGYSAEGRLVGCTHVWEDAKVTLKGPHSVLASSPVQHDGSFAFGKIPAGTYKLELSEAPGHESYGKLVEMSGNRRELTLNTYPIYLLRVEFRDEHGHRIKEARIPCERGVSKSELFAIGGTCDEGVSDPTFEQADAMKEMTPTSHSSRYDANAGYLELYAHPPFCVGAYLDRTPLDVQAIPAGAELVVFEVTDLLLESMCGNVRGVVLDQTTNEGIEEKRAVGVINSEEKSFYILQGTGADGAFVIENVRAGPAVLLFEFDDYVRASQQIRIRPGETLDVGRIYLEPSTFVTGVIVDRRERRVMDLGIRLITSSEASPIAGFKTLPVLQVDNKQGWFSAACLQSGEYCFAIQHSSLASRPVVVSVGSEPVRGVQIVVEDGVPLTIMRNPGEVGVDANAIERTWSGHIMRYPLSGLDSETVALLPGKYTVAWMWMGKEMRTPVELASTPQTIVLGKDEQE